MCAWQRFSRCLYNLSALSFPRRQIDSTPRQLQHLGVSERVLDNSN